MNEIKGRIANSATTRWLVVILVSLTMMCGYFLTDIMAPLKTMLEGELGWSSTEYGIFTSSYGWFNIMLFMLIISGIILDRLGIRFTGVAACLTMIAGTAIKYWAISTNFENADVTFAIGSWHIATMDKQVLFASLGYATFGVGVEAIGITASKAIVKWFKGREMALALGINVAMARIGTAFALFYAPKIVAAYGNISTPILMCLILLCIGLLTFLSFCIADRKLDKETAKEKEGQVVEPEEEFHLRDILSIIKMNGFWYIAILCVLFYSAVFPFLKYAADLMVNKFGFSPETAGEIPSILPIGNMLLTPLFGYMYDRIGKGASIMIFGSALLIFVHVMFALPGVSSGAMALTLMFLLGVAFSLVPSAMWPSVPKIVDEKRLGTAYSLIFWIQNWGLSGVPLLIGYVLDKYCITGSANGVTSYNYTLPMFIFASFGVLALGFAFLLKREDKIKGYGLEQPNIKK